MSGTTHVLRYERPTTLAQALAPAAVDLALLRRRYGPLLELVRRLIGVVPNCDRYLEIWPTAFRSYNLMVPNLLNLPFFLWGLGAPKGPVGLAMYRSSRVAQCMYCSAHTCSFALRRGLAETKVADTKGDTLSQAERAAVAVAEGMARVPARVDASDRDALVRHLGPDHEWVVLGIAMMGFLNKMMDALGVELEAATVAEVRAVIEPSGWITGQHVVVPTRDAVAPARGDGLALKVGVLRFLPGALALNRRWAAGVPSHWPAIGSFLHEHTGHDFPVLSRLAHGRAVRAIATMLRDNCDPFQARLGLHIKHRAGLVYATVVGDPELASELRVLANHAGAEDLDSVERFAAAPLDSSDGDAVARAAREHGSALVLAKAAAHSPARVSPDVIAMAQELPADAVVELVTWLSVLQLLHRLNAFYTAAR
jgi:alkylhydroperoxidase family enzyme